MIVIFLLIPMSIIVAGIFLFGFIWAVRSGQFEDTCTPALRLLADESNGKKTVEAKNPTGEGVAVRSPDHKQIVRKK